MIHLPSNKVLGSFIITIALVFSIIIAFGREKSGEAINFANNLVAGEKISIPENTDWKNELNEISISGDPIKLAEANNEASQKTTLTESVSVSLMSNYLSLRQNESLDIESAQNLIDQTDSFLYGYGLTLYTEKDLNIIEDNTKLALERYGEELGNILKNSKSGKKMINEVEVFKEAVGSEDPEKLKELENVAKVYDQISLNMLKMQVPRVSVKAHLDMVNGIRGVSLALNNLKDLFTDPVLGLEGMRKYQESAQFYFSARKATAQFLLVKKVNYKQGSGGYYLIYGI